MKQAITAAAAALILAGCQQSIEQQFSSMCAEQRSNSDAPQIGSELCAAPTSVPPVTMEMALKMYNDQRDRLEASR